MRRARTCSRSRRRRCRRGQRATARRRVDQPARLDIVAGGTSAFSWAGTAAITIVYVVALTSGAIASVATRRWPRALLLGAGAALLALASVNIGLQEDVDNATSTPVRTLASVALVAAFAGGTAAQVWLLVRLGDRLRRSSADQGGSSERSQPRRRPSQARWSAEMLPH